MYIDIVLILYMYCVNIFLGWCEKIVRRADAQGSLTINLLEYYSCQSNLYISWFLFEGMIPDGMWWYV